MASQYAGSEYPRCGTANRYGVPLPGPVRASCDRRRRMTETLDFRTPRGLRWGQAVAERAGHLDGAWALRLRSTAMDVDSDIPYARSAEERHWARVFYARSLNSRWCLFLGRFDRRTSAWLTLAYTLSPSSMREIARAERRWRHDNGLLLWGFQTDGAS